MRKIAALTAALCLASSLLCGCRSEKQLTEDFEVPKQGCENAIALESGEIMIYASVKAEKDVPVYATNSSTETYIKFVQGEALEYDLTANTTITSTGETSTFEATQEMGELVQLQDGVVISAEEPDIFEGFRINYTTADIESIEVVSTGDGLTLYAVTMTGAYADTFDLEADGVKSDCTKVLYNYYVDASGVTRTVLSEFTRTVTSDGESQSVTEFTQTKIN
ncbi:MAG: hypothetical protein IJ493_04950 [Clostridia bacterium]|nr:hypothetical protein [Clostridia bacterium]